MQYFIKSLLWTDCPSLEAISLCLYIDYSVNLLARFALQLCVRSNKTRSGQIKKCFHPLAPAVILHIIGTILRQTNQNQSKKKRKLLSRVRWDKFALFFRHLKSIFFWDGHRSCVWICQFEFGENCCRRMATIKTKVHQWRLRKTINVAWIVRDQIEIG